MSGCPTQAISDYLSTFEIPDPQFSPVPIWWWSGEPLEINRLRWQMDQLLAMGICNVLVLNLAANGPIFGSDADDPPFMSPAWWEIFRQVCEHARGIGMGIWFYDQTGFSGANFQANLVAAHPEFAGEHLASVVAEGTGLLQVECPVAATPIAAYVVELADASTVTYLKLHDRRATANVEKPSRLRLIYSTVKGYDYFSAPAVQALMAAVHGQFADHLAEYLGTTIRGSFQDELPNLPTWSRSFADLFAASAGFRIETSFHALFEEGGPGERRVRLLYHRHRANLAEAALFKPMYGWHEDHGLICGFDQQSPAREADAVAGTEKYADYLQTHRWYAAPGCDHHGHAKIHSSLAFLHHRPRVWFEGFHSSGWGGTLADTFDWLLPFLQAGINLYDPHAVYYGMRQGWWEWAPPSTCFRQPYAVHYRSFAHMMARLTKLLSQGVQQAQIAVLYPTATVQASQGIEQTFPLGVAAERTLRRVIGRMKWHAPERGALDQALQSYHLFDEPSLCRSHIGEGMFTYRHVAFHTLVLPDITIVDDETVRWVRKFLGAGGHVTAIGSSRLETSSGAAIDLRNVGGVTVVLCAEDLVVAVGNRPREIEAPVPTQHRKDGTRHLLFVPAIAGMATSVQFNGTHHKLEHATIDPAAYMAAMDIALPISAGNVVRYDPIDNSIAAVSTQPEGGRVQLRLDFRGASFALLAWDESDTLPSESVSAFVPCGQQRLSDQWRCRYVSSLDFSYNDIGTAENPDLRWPHTSLFEWVAGVGDPTLAAGMPRTPLPAIVAATFGIYGTIHLPERVRSLCYSLRAGIERDEIHLRTWGPKGYVPDEFADMGDLSAGETAVIETGVISPLDTDAVLVVGAGAAKSLELNGQSFVATDAGYLWTPAVHVRKGVNHIKLAFTAERAARVRAFWCFVDPQHLPNMNRSERIASTRSVGAGCRLIYRGRFENAVALANGKLQIAVAGVAAVYLDGQLLGRQGGFDPYKMSVRMQAYDLPPLAAICHEVVVELIGSGAIVPLVADLRAYSADGQTWTWGSDASWQWSGDHASFVPVNLYSTPDVDPSAAYLYRRPHALPQTAWLQGPQAPGVLPWPPLAQAEPTPQWFRWVIPPGAQSMDLRLSDVTDVQLWINSQPVTPAPDGQVDLSRETSACRGAILFVRSLQSAGGVFEGPVRYTFGDGILHIGSWVEQGLRSYSGMIQMLQKFHMDLPSAAHRAALDLGSVRGTVAVKLNGIPIGQRFMLPYTFEVTDQLRPGLNELELLCTNTLANYLSTWSPTRSWSADQLDAGVLGPATLMFEFAPLR